MSQVQLYAKKQGTEEYIALDLYPEEPIKLNFSVQNIEDPLAATSTFSRTFKVPNTSVNSPYFKAVFNVNSVDFDASQKADAYINDNNIYFTSGNIRLNAIYRGEKEDSVQYEITFYGETSDFGSKIGGGFLNELNFSQYNHNKSWNNVSASWTNGLFNGDIVYGLIEWGYNYNANNQPIEPTLSNGFNNSFTLPSKALWLEQWKPQFRAKAIWDQVFEESGYTYDSTFLDSVLFKKMYVISDNVAQATLDNSNTFEAYSNRFVGTVLGATQTLTAEVEVSDPGNNWTPTTSRYRAPSTGTYIFTLNYDLYIDIFDPFGQPYEYASEINVVDEANNSIGYASSNITTDFYNAAVTIYCNLTAGQVVHFEHNSYRLSGPIYTGSTRIEISNLIIKCIDAPNILSINGIMPSNIRKIDFMRSIINRFRLVFVPSREIKNHFTITPWKDWILEGKALDWTSKLDTSKDLKITPLFYGQDRFQIYKDQEDGDFINYQYQLTYKQTVGQLNLDSTNELIKGTKVYQDSFAPTPISPIGFKEGDLQGSRFLVPHIAKDVGSTDDTAGTTVITGKREPIQPKLRLVFYNGLIVAPLTWYARKQNGGSGAYETLTAYPLMSAYSSWPVSSSTFDLNWENEAPFWDPTDPQLGNGQTAFSQFNTYWKTWYDVTFDPYSRIVEANLIMDYDDILDLKFNDYVFIKDTWYFVNNIADFIAGQKTNCRVQLVKVGNNIGITLPIVTDVQYTPVNLCKATTACFAFCCNVNVGGNPVSGTYYIDGASLASANRVFADQYGSIVAPDGFYSDGITTVQVTNGNITSVINTDLCDCNVTSYAFTVKFATTLCGPTGVCCNGITQTVYGANPSFGNNAYLYYNAALTTPVGLGWYREISATDALRVEGLLGQVVEVGTCTACPPCETLYPHTVCYSGPFADPYLSCCCDVVQSVWTNNSIFTASTMIYSDNSGNTPAPNGNYNENGDIAIVDTGTPGAISAFADCIDSTTPCTTNPVEIEVSLTAEAPGYTSSATLYKSFDGTNWVGVGTISIAPTDPANTTALTTFTVQELSYTKCTFTTNTIDGTLVSEVVVNFSQIQEHANATPVSYTEVLAGTVTSSNSYRYSGVIEGGLVPICRVYAGGQINYYQSAQWPVMGQTISGILGLNPEDAVIDTDFNASTGFGPINSAIYAIENGTDNSLVVGGGGFTTYKSTTVTKGAVLLNSDGTLNTSFNTLIGALTNSGQGNNIVRAIAVDTVNGIAYLGGDFQYWDKGPLGGTSDPDYNSPRMIALNLSDGSVNTTFRSRFNSDQTSQGTIRINSIRLHGDKIYVGGIFDYYDGTNYSGIVRLNLDGTPDPSWIVQGIADSGTPGVEDIQFRGNYIYVAGRFTNWNNSSGVASNHAGLVRLNLSDGSLDTGFNTAGGFTSFGVRSIALDDSGIYCVGRFTTFAGSSGPRNILKIDYSANVVTAFNYGNGLQGYNQTANKVVLDTDGFIYVAGEFNTYDSVTTRGLVKINATTGALDTSFPIAGGLTVNFAADPIVKTVLVDCGPPPVVTYPISLCYSALFADPCDAYCCNGGLESFWANADNLYSATILYSNAEGTIPAGPGYFSDGTSIAEVDSLGNIVAYVNPSGCNCGPVLYPFDVLYSSSITCNACCGDLIIRVYSTNSSWGASPILYSDAGGTTPVLDGHYGYAGLVNNVSDGDGIVTSQSTCDFCYPCPSQECIAYAIRNTSSYQIFYSYTSCSLTYYSGTIEPGETIYTTCLQLSNFFATGTYSIQGTAFC
jgi:hypothetical protein